jgi:hypothetical protein
VEPVEAENDGLTDALVAGMVSNKADGLVTSGKSVLRF